MRMIQKRIITIVRVNSKTRAPLCDRDRSTVLVVVLRDGAVLAAHRAGPEDRRASDKMAINIRITRCCRERWQRVALAGRRRRGRMWMRVRMGSPVIGADPGERGGRRRHWRRYRRLGARGHHGNVGRRYGTRQRPGARQGAGAGAYQVSAHYVTRRAHRRGIVGPAGRIADDGRRRTRIAVVAHIAPTTVVHFHAVEAHVVGRRRARVTDITRLRHCNIRYSNINVNMNVIENKAANIRK